MSYTLNWISLRSKEEFDRIIEDSRSKPALIFKHRTTSPESNHIKEMMEKNGIFHQNSLNVTSLM